MDRLDAMQAFVRVAELGSFAAAAQQINVARSVVTRQIAALERYLGVKLMVRSTRRLTLTSAGAAYLEKCRVILTMLDSAEGEVAAERHIPRGHIRLSVPLSFGLKRLTPLLLQFAQHYPEVQLETEYSDRHAHLIEEGIDLSIRITAQPEASDIVRVLGETRLAVVAAPSYLAQYGEPQHPLALQHHTCLAYVRSGQRQSWQFWMGEHWLTVPIRSQFAANNGDVLTEAAAQGLGLTCQPDFIVADWLAQGKVQTVLTDFPCPRPKIYAVLPSNRHIPYRVRVLMDFLAAQLANQ